MKERRSSWLFKSFNLFICTGLLLFASGAMAAADPVVSDTSTDEDTLSPVITIGPGADALTKHFLFPAITGGKLFLTASDGGAEILIDEHITVDEAANGVRFDPTANSVTAGTFTVFASYTPPNAPVGTNPSSNVVVTITINDVNDTPVVDDQTFDVDENTANGTVVGTVIATDIEFDLGTQALTYEITGSAFDIDNSGVITVASTGDLDREAQADFTPTVTVTDDGTPIKSDTAIITIDLNPINDNSPVGILDVVSVDELDTLVFNVLTEGTDDIDDDLPAETLTVSAVAGDPVKVGVAQDLIADAVTVGSLTIAADGTATFVATADNTVEKFQVTQTYTVSDGTFEDIGVLVTIDINPLNDNQPALTAAGTAFAAAGVTYDEGDQTEFSKLTISMESFFIDLDIDEDGLQDASTGDDNDSISFVVLSNSNATLVDVTVVGSDLVIYSPEDEHGTADIKIRVTDSADPASNISSVDLDFTITVNSQNDAPIYIDGTYTNMTVDEDSADIPLPLNAAFEDADIDLDSDPSDDSQTYTITIDDVPAIEDVDSVYIDLPFTVISEIQDVPVAGGRRTVYETTSSSMAIQLAQDAHGYLDITIRATDQGRPPELPAAAVPLFDEESFRITVAAVGDDTPVAADDHYDDFPTLIIDEDSGELIFNVVANDYLGDAPTLVLIAGTTITDTTGATHTWRSTSRLADRDNTGDFLTQINGEVGCAQPGCLDDETSNTSIDAAGINNWSIMYKPGLDFNGEDSFTYCIQDASIDAEAAFTPPSDARCGTVTVLVNPVNDLPRIPADIIYTMDQADDLIVDADAGLVTFVTGVDNTQVDGLGCDPFDPDCAPGPGDPQPDGLFFFFNSAVTTNGQLIPPFLNDGSFNYRPSAAFAGSDSFLFDVCETLVPTVDTCVFDVLVSIIIDPIQGAAEGLSDSVVEVNFDLADTPLELPVGPEANVLIVNDDSGSMNWDIMTDQTSGKYFFPTGDYLLYVLKATNQYSSSVAPSEERAPNQGLWRLRNSEYNKIYYNPAVRYDPWDGVNPDNVDFPQADPTAAKHNPMSPGGHRTNLRDETSYGGRAIFDGRIRNVTTSDHYLPRHYIWDDKNGDGNMDKSPSPSTHPDTSEGILVEIRPASEGGSDTYPRGSGRTDCIEVSGFCSFTEELQNFANWFTYSRNRQYTSKSALGKVVAGSKNIRIGYGKLNSATRQTPIESMNSSVRTGAKAALLDAIYLTGANGGTPLRRALRDAGRHFECRRNDIFNSGQDTLPGENGCPVFAAPAGNCQQNFALLISDGAWTGRSPFIGDADDDTDSGDPTDTEFDAGRYAGGYDNSLADVAMHYYERDLHPTLLNEVPTSARDIDGAAEDAFEDSDNVLMHQHMKTYVIGFGVVGTVEEDDIPTDYTQSFNWDNPTSTATKIDDMRHAALNGRGIFVSAGSAATLSKALVSAFEEFQQGSGAASAVSFNSQEIQEDTLIFRSFYNTKNNTGDLVAQGIDGDGVVDEEVTWSAAQRLDLVDPDNRVIITLDRDPLSLTYAEGIPFRPATLNDPQRAAFISDSGATQAEQDLEVSERVGYLRGENDNERPDGNLRERPEVEGRMGDLVHSAPTFIGAPSRLGRDVEPFPQSPLYSSFRQANEVRQAIVYVAANDGMLHGFDAETGDEEIAYVPDNLMTNTYSRKITELLSYEYTHKYFVDSTPAVNDVFIDADGDGDKEWITILIGGHGAGAKAYFALDITDPSNFNEVSADQVTLWEFTDADDTYPTDSLGDPLLDDDDLQRQDLLSPAQPVKDLGYSFSVPTIAMSNLVDPDGENKWIAISGSGYNSTSGIAKLFVHFLGAGVKGYWCHPDMIHNVGLNGPLRSDCVGKQDFVKLDTGFGVQSGMPNGLGEPRVIDVDGNGTADYAYAGDMFGNFFRFDLTDEDYANWSVTKIFEAQYKPDTVDEMDQPITTQPIAIIHPTEEEGFILIFGTGAYLRRGDSTDMRIQSIYGLWDRLGPEFIEKSDLQEQFYTNFDDPLGLVRTLTDNPVDYSIVGGQKGWFIDLDSPPPGFPQGSPADFPGEKAIRNIQLRGGLAFVNSIFPRELNSCVGRAGGATLSFCPDTGGSLCFGNRAIFDLNNDGTFDAGDDINTDETAAGVLLEDPSPPTDSTFIGDKRVTQYGRELHIIGTNTSSGDNTGRLSWKRLESVD